MQIPSTDHPFLASPAIVREIIASVREPFALLDADLRLVSASRAFFLRFSLENSVIGSVVYDWGAGEWDTPRVRELFEDLAPVRESVEGFVLEIQVPGTPRTEVVASLQPLREGSNSAAGYLLTTTDAGPSSGTRPGDLISTLRSRSGDIALCLDPDNWRITAGDGSVLQMTGFSAEELEGRPLTLLLHAVDQESVLERLSSFAHAGDPDLRIVFRLRHRNGRFLWVDGLCHAEVNTGSCRRVLLVGRDVSDQKQSEEALRWLGRQTKLILDSAADGIFGVDTSGVITFINPAAARILKNRVPELLSQSYRSFFKGEPTDGGDQALDVVAETLRDGLDRRIREQGFLCSDGTTVPVELSCSGSREHGEITGAVITFRDITERKLAESANRRADWLSGVGETTVAIRHELNNPLTTLLAEAHLLEMGGNTPAEERDMIAAICDQARRIADVIRRLTERQGRPVVKLEGSQRMIDLSSDESQSGFGIHDSRFTAQG